MNGQTRKLFTLSLVTWPKFLIYILPLGCTVLIKWYMIPVLACIAWGIRKSTTAFEKACGIAMIASWLIWGWHLGPWVAFDQRQGWQVLLTAAVLYFLVEESEYQKRVNGRKPEAWKR
jgi:hypothetical protein